MTPTTEPTIDQQRTALEGRLVELLQLDEPAVLALKAQEALDRKHEAIGEIQRQLDEIDAATDARAQKRRADAAQARLNEREVLRQQLIERYEVFLKAIADAEAHAKQLADNLRTAYETYKTISSTALAVTGDRKLNLSANDLVGRLSHRLSGTMRAGLHRDHRTRFGVHQWSGADYFPVNQPWADAEEKSIARTIIPIIEKKDA